jgi:hypothetical protein
LSSSSSAFPTTPTGFTSIATATADAFTSNKGGTTYYYHRMRTCYKVLTAGDTSITSTTGYSSNMMSVEVYRPSAAITTVAAQDVATTSSNTINCSASSVATIAFGASGRYYTGVPTHTWGAGPTVNQALTYLRAGSYVQGASPSNVTWSSNSYFVGYQEYRTIFTSGYLEIS